MCLVEPCATHAEVLFPLIELLRSDYDVHVIAPRRLLDLDLLTTTRHLFTAWPLEKEYAATRWKGFAGLVAKYRDIRRIVREAPPDFILFNSTYRRFERLLIALLLRRYPKGQIIHEFQHCLRWGGHWLYDRFDLNLVISEQVYEYVHGHHPEFAGLDYILPIFFDGFLQAAGNGRHPHNGNGVVKLGVFGSIDAWRRNYRGLLDAVSATAAPGTDPRYEIFLVGKAPSWLKEEVRERESAALVRTFDDFVPFKQMFDLVNEVDLVLFLIDSSVSNAQFYNRYKITGTSVLMKAFNKAAACSTEFLVDEILAGRCFYYEGADLQSLLASINEGRLSSGDIADRLRSSADPAGMGFAEQREKLAALVGQARRNRAKHSKR